MDASLRPSNAPDRAARNRTVLLVLNYKKYSDSINFLQSLMDTGLTDADVVILDNASGNDSVPELRAWIEAHFPAQGDDILDTNTFTLTEPRFAEGLRAE